MNKIEQGIATAQATADAAVPKTGGTMTGPLSVPSTLTIRKENDTGEGGQIQMDGSNGNPLWIIDVYNDELRIMQNWENRVRIRPDDMFFKGARVWNAINDGSGSGLDADTLDGLHSVDFVLSRGIWQTNGRDFAAHGKRALVAFNTADGNYLSINFNRDFANGVNVGGPLTADGNRVWDASMLRVNNGVLEYNNGGVWTPVGGIKGVQRGYTSVNFGTNNASRYHDISISAVNPAKAQLNLLTSASYVGVVGNPTIDLHNVSIRLISATTIRVEWTLPVNRTPGGDDLRPISWEVIESY
ncbi:hypothetical protein [Paenibacillus ginsengihumi]|uniref:hypothetical protein n=1 Tax=Paenibacillus ginsengihumi TaxID=431596 RepID=UPI001B7FE0E2|nr:hypothetical protein [Paenibacillus ginsengihumi]